MDYTKEYILCAAIRRVKPRVSEFPPYWENDIMGIELGYRHHDIFVRFGKEVSNSPNDQGFYTSKGRFVGRKDAVIVAIEAGQVPKDFKGNRLFSEDLY